MIYRPEHPNPQWERENWLNLNGEWEFDFDFGRSARERELFSKGALPRKINVPFCPESELSGIGYTDFMDGVCYRKLVSVSEKQLEGRVHLHFGAVDFKSYVYINGRLANTHIGGFSSFSVDITEFLKAGENEIFVIAEDDTRSCEQARGKQSARYASKGCSYTRTTGIWQTVWLEFTPKAYVRSAKYYADIKTASLNISGELEGEGELKISAFYDGRAVGGTTVKSGGGKFFAKLTLSELNLWEPGCGRLYDLIFEYGADKVKSYFGIRSIRLDGKKFMLNSKCVFQRFVLDQGFYPDGIYTAKTEEDMRRDIEISMAAGFNGARLHQKVFEKRFLYNCDKAGYMVWGEYANWGVDYKNIVSAENFICEWIEVVTRDFNHPSIIGWCPGNETHGYIEAESNHRILETVYRITKALDPERPCIETSGYYHTDMAEIFDVHEYCDDLEVFKDAYAHINEGKVLDEIQRREGDVQKYNGQPVFVSEYGGQSLVIDGANAADWGYGYHPPKSAAELFERYRDFTNALLDNPDIMGFCYTQLYDVEQEKNGIYTYERVPKLDINAVREVNQRTAKIEEL